jgi:CHAD domain-containing protein
MAVTNHSVHPITTLRDAATSLEASILLCLAVPKKETVHRLRTLTRRIEAQLELLAMLPGLPHHEEQARNTARLLKKLRHAAGQVRDIDVQRDLIRNQAAASTNGAAHPSHGLRHQARHLSTTLKHQRDEAEAHLLRLLHKQRMQLPLAFEELLKTLAPAESLTLTEPHLTTLVLDIYHNSHAPSAIPQDTAALHEIRKRAKLARYLAESAPASAAARRLASRFERLQQAGGQWHDWLILTDIATREFGDSAPLAQRFAAETRTALRTFQRRLRAFSSTDTAKRVAA